MSDVPIRAITTGPRHHWFGYYDKHQFDPTNRYVLGMEVDFEGRQPRADDEISLGMIDTASGDSWREIGRTTAWCWQQGCMLQWLPGSAREVIWNERDGDHYVSRILNVDTGHSRVLGAPIYTIAPDGQTAIGTDFRRIDHMRPGYGYAGIPDPNHDTLAPETTGIYRLDLSGADDGRAGDLIISIADVAALPYRHGDLSEAKHYFNHLLFNTDGSRFIFLHRWRFGDGGFNTRMMTAAVDGSDLHVVDDYGKMSHFMTNSIDIEYAAVGGLAKFVPTGNSQIKPVAAVVIKANLLTIFTVYIELDRLGHVEVILFFGDGAGYGSNFGDCLGIRFTDAGIGQNDIVDTVFHLFSGKYNARE